MRDEQNSTFLMANLGSELARLLASRARNDKDGVTASLERCRDILRAFNQQCRTEAHREEGRLIGEVIERQAQDNGTSPTVSSESLRRYFIPFAMRVMANKSH